MFYCMFYLLAIALLLFRSLNHMPQSGIFLSLLCYCLYAYTVYRLLCVPFVFMYELFVLIVVVGIAFYVCLFYYCSGVRLSY